MPEELQWETEENEGRKDMIRKEPNLSILWMYDTIKKWKLSTLEIIKTVG